MKASLQKTLDACLASKCKIERGNDCATVTQDHLNLIREVVRELIEATIEGDHKGRSWVTFRLRSFHTDMVENPIRIPPIPDEPTAQELGRALETANVNVKIAQGLVERLIQQVPYVKEAQGAQSS